jgi:hypothetical protein
MSGNSPRSITDMKKLFPKHNVEVRFGFGALNARCDVSRAVVSTGRKMSTSTSCKLRMLFFARVRNCVYGGMSDFHGAKFQLNTTLFPLHVAERSKTAEKSSMHGGLTDLASAQKSSHCLLWVQDMQPDTHKPNPVQPDNTSDDSWRYPDRLRALMATHVLAGLSWDDRKAVSQGEPFPNKGPAGKDSHDTLYQLVRAHDGFQATSQRAVIDSAKKFAKRLLVYGTLASKAPQKKGARLQKALPHLKLIRELLLKGYKDRRGHIRPYRNIQGLIKKQEEVKTMMDNKLVAGTPGGLWRQLKKAFPKLRRMKQRVKKVRQFKKVQVRSVFFLYNKELTALGFEVAFQECSSVLFLKHFACMCALHRSRWLFKQSLNSVAWDLFDVPAYTCCSQGSGCLFFLAQVTLHAMCLLRTIWVHSIVEPTWF